jgi:hypothetical protein
VATGHYESIGHIGIYVVRRYSERIDGIRGNYPVAERLAQKARAAARSAVYKGGSLLGLTVVRVFAGYAVFL